jgi:VWFA-related protein
MHRTFFRLLLLLLISTFVVQLSSAQSGRKRKTDNTKTDPKATSSTPGDTSEEVLESRTAPGGETVEGDVIRFDTSLVTVPVTVVDRSGRFVPTMRRQDFHIFENGVEQKIAYFATSDQPFTVVLLIDTSGSTQFRLEDMQAAAISFVSKLKPNDSVVVISFDDRIEVRTRATVDREVISRAIRRTRTGGATRLYDAVDAALKQELAAIRGRKAVVLFTDGVDTASRKATYETTLREAEESDAPIYSLDYDTQGTVGVMGQGLPIPGGRGGIVIGGWPFPGSGRGGGVGSTAADYRRGVQYLHALSDSTGGRFYSADSLIGIGQAFTWIAEELGRQYSLGYYPRELARSGERRQIKVRVEQPDLVVKARDSYIFTQKPINTPGQKNTPVEKQPYQVSH